MSPSVLVDTSVFCRAVQFKPYKGVSLVEMLNRIWRDCFKFVISPQLNEEYKRCLINEGVGSPLQVHEFIEALGDKAEWVDVTDEEVKELLRRHEDLDSIDTDVPHLIAAAKAGAELIIFDDGKVEDRKEIIKRILGVTVINPLGFYEKAPRDHCIERPIPFPFTHIGR